MKPIVLIPNYLKSVWAGSRLKKIRGLSEDGIGISREVCAYKGAENIIANPPFTGQKISEVIAQHHDQLLGKSDDSDQLIRCAYMDPIEDLSIQVHPNEVQGKEKGDYEKSESWYILEAKPDAYVLAGMDYLSKAEIKEAIKQETLSDYIHKIPVQAGDFVHIPCQMLHACGKDVLALEIGSFGGITYRLYDYGRGRKLDEEEGLKVLDSSLAPTLIHLQSPLKERTSLLKHRIYSIDALDVDGSYVLKKSDRYRIIISVSGNGEVLYQNEIFPLVYTSSILLPADCDKVTVRGKLRILISYRS